MPLQNSIEDAPDATPEQHRRLVEFLTALKERAWLAFLSAYPADKDGEDAIVNFTERNSEFSEILCGVFSTPQAKRHAAYHVLTGSTLGCPKLDFPNDYSVQKFFERIISGEEPMPRPAAHSLKPGGSALG